MFYCFIQKEGVSFIAVNWYDNLTFLKQSVDRHNCSDVPQNSYSENFLKCPQRHPYESFLDDFLMHDFA